MEKSFRKDWGSALLVSDKQLTDKQHTGDLWRVRLKNPRKSLIVNTFVYRDASVVAVIDPGWPFTLDALDEALVDLDLGGIAGVDRWIYTHSHIDHMGAAALIEQRSDAPHLAWSGLEPHLGRWHAFQDEVHMLGPWVEQAFTEPHRSRLLSRLKEEYSLVDHHGPAGLERVELFDFGARVEVGDLTLEWVDARGHDPYHAALWEPERGWLFSGDVALAVPTPLCRAMDDDVAAYRASVDRLAALEPTLLLPGHGLHRRDDDAAAAFERARGFFERYELGVRQALEGRDGPVDLYELALELTPEGRPLRPFGRWWVHLALVDSHVWVLRAP